MKDIAVIYYSLEGNTQLVAEAVAEEAHADLFRIRPLHEIPRRGLLKYVVGGKQVVFGTLPEIEALDLDLAAYRTLFIGSPVRAGSLVPPMHTFLKQHSLSGKQLAIFCSYRGSADETVEMIRALAAGAQFRGSIALRDPLRSNEHEVTSRVRSWVHTVLSEVEK